MERRALTLPILAALLPVFAWRTGIHCEASGHALGARMGAALSALEQQLDPTVDSNGAAPASDDTEVGDDSVVEHVELEVAPTESDHSKRRNARSSSKMSPGVFIGGRTVLELAARGVVPGGHWVPARDSRPAGILLSRVSGLGVGMADGDVLTSVEGRPVRTEAQVVAVVLAARARQESNVSAVFWRAGTPRALIVEMPYPRGSSVSE